MISAEQATKDLILATYIKLEPYRNAGMPILLDERQLTLIEKIRGRKFGLEVYTDAMSRQIYLDVSLNEIAVACIYQDNERVICKTSASTPGDRKHILAIIERVIVPWALKNRYTCDQYWKKQLQEKERHQRAMARAAERQRKLDEKEAAKVIQASERIKHKIEHSVETIAAYDDWK